MYDEHDESFHPCFKQWADATALFLSTKRKGVVFASFGIFQEVAVTLIHVDRSSCTEMWILN